MIGTPPNWPEGVREINVENLASLGINDSGELFWNGRRIEVRRRLRLSWWQNAGAAAVVIATVLGGLGGFAQGAVAVVDFGCARKSWTSWCAAVPQPAIQAAQATHEPAAK
jgi:hypothetical protein